MNTLPVSGKFFTNYMWIIRNTTMFLVSLYSFWTYGFKGRNERCADKEHTHVETSMTYTADRR